MKGMNMNSLDYWKIKKEWWPLKCLVLQRGDLEIKRGDLEINQRL